MEIEEFENFLNKKEHHSFETHKIVWRIFGHPNVIKVNICNVL